MIEVFVSLQSVAVVQRSFRACDPAEVMEELGFGPLLLKGSFPVSMSGEMSLIDMTPCSLSG